MEKMPRLTAFNLLEIAANRKTFTKEEIEQHRAEIDDLKRNLVRDLGPSGQRLADDFDEQKFMNLRVLRTHTHEGI